MEELTKIAGELAPHVVRSVVIGAWMTLVAGIVLVTFGLIIAPAGAVWCHRKGWDDDFLFVVLVACIPGVSGLACILHAVYVLLEPIGAAVRSLAGG